METIGSFKRVKTPSERSPNDASYVPFQTSSKLIFTGCKSLSNKPAAFYMIRRNYKHRGAPSFDNEV